MKIESIYNQNRKKLFSIVTSDILTESEKFDMNQILNAWFSKLKSIVTPGILNNTDLLLTLVSPKGGGIPSLKELLKQAKQSNTILSNDENWWNSLFKIFNINGDAQEPIKLGALSSIKQEQIPEKQPHDSGSNTPRQENNDLLSKLKAEKEAAEAARSELLKLIASRRVNIDSAVEKLRELSAKIDKLKSEDVDNILKVVLEFKSIKSINEDDRLDRFRERLANVSVNKISQSAMNTLIAKEAIKLSISHTKNKLASRLRELGITYEQVISDYKRWKKLKKSSPNSQEFHNLNYKLSGVFKLLHGISDNQVIQSNTSLVDTIYNMAVEELYNSIRSGTNPKAALMKAYQIIQKFAKTDEQAAKIAWDKIVEIIKNYINRKKS